MPSNPVEEARNRPNSYRRVGEFMYPDGPPIRMVDWAHLGGERYHFPEAIEQVIREQERSRYEGLLAEAIKFLESFGGRSAVRKGVYQPHGRCGCVFEEWQEFVRNHRDRCIVKSLRAALTPSAPAEETQTADWIVRQVADAKEAIRTGPKWLQNAAAEHAARRAPAEKEG